MPHSFWWAIVTLCVALLAGEAYSQASRLPFHRQIAFIRSIWIAAIFVLLIQLIVHSR